MDISNSPDLTPQLRSYSDCDAEPYAQCEDEQSAKPPGYSAGRVLAAAKWFYTRVLMLWVLLIAVSFVLVAVLASFAYWKNQTLKEQMVSSLPAGHAVSIQRAQGPWTDAQIETDTGWYVVADAMSLQKGEALTLQRYANGERYLCDTGHYCAELVHSRWNVAVTHASQVGEQAHY